MHNCHTHDQINPSRSQLYIIHILKFMRVLYFFTLSKKFRGLSKDLALKTLLYISSLIMFGLPPNKITYLLASE